MLLMTMSLAVTVIAMSMFLAMNPLTMGLLILMMALLLALSFSCSMSSWVAFLIFLIYIGGMLVMFSYFVSITPNQTLEFSYNAMVMTFSFLMLFSASVILNLKPSISQTHQLYINTMYLPQNIPCLMLLASILLLTMVVVVKLTVSSKGPLRPFS